MLIEDHIKLSKEDRQRHLSLAEPCNERGGNSTQHRGIMVEYLDVTFPTGRILLCHACGNGKCSNPRHLYWGTDKENIIEDGTKFGTYKSAWEHTVAKYGYEEACLRNSRKMIGNTNGSKNFGKAKSEEHKKKIAAGVKRTYNNIS
jgi:hypothetical protein